MSSLALDKAPNQLTADELDKQLGIARTMRDLPALHVLAEERLSRDEFVSGITRRQAMLRQAVDLEIIGGFETWKLGGNYDTFYAYLYERKLEYERRGYDAEGDILVVKGYPTVMAWCNIIRHYHERHGMPLEVLAYVPKAKLEVASGTCNAWDAAHEGVMDEDLKMLLFDSSIPKGDLLARYAKLKERQGVEAPVVDYDTGEEENTDPNEAEHEIGDGGIETMPEYDAEVELDVTMDTETGDLSAWVKKGNGHIPLMIGRLNIRDESKRELITNLCSTWGIRLK